jgi:hypothetical protein
MVAGNIADISVSLQAVKGTPAATGQFRSYLLGGGLGPARDINDVEETSSSRLRSTAYVGQISAEGEPQFAVRPNMIGAYLYAAMGGKAVTGAGDPWTHTFTLANTQPYLTLFRMLGAGLFERFSDAKITSLQFASTAGGILAVTVGIAGLTPAFKTTAETTVQPETTEPFLHMDAKAQFVFEGSAVSRIRSSTLTIATGAEATFGDSSTGDDVSEGMHEITLETEQTIVDFAAWNRFHYGTASPADNAPPSPLVIELGAPGISIKYSKRTAAGIDATPARSLEFTATRVQIAGIEGQDPNTDGSPLTRTVTYKVYQPAAGGSGLTAILKNGTSAYTAI